MFNISQILTHLQIQGDIKLSDVNESVMSWKQHAAVFHNTK